MHYEDLIKDHALTWPYPVNYAKELRGPLRAIVTGGTR